MQNVNNKENNKLNSTLGFLKSVNDKFNEKTIDENITAKEKKFLELNPSLKVDQFRELKDKKNEDIKSNKKVSFNFDKPNNSKFNRVKLNTSNIFHDQVYIIQMKYILYKN